MAVRGGVVVTAVLPVSPPIVELPATVGTLPVFTHAGAEAKISDSVFRQTAVNGILIGAGANGTGAGAVCIGPGANGQLGVANCVALGAASAGSEDIAIGYAADAVVAIRSIAIGKQAKVSFQLPNFAPSNDNIAIGTGAEGGGGNKGLNVAIGPGAKASYGMGIAIGNGALAKAGDSGIAIGDGAATAGNGAGDNLAIGSHAVAGIGTMGWNVSIGRNASATQGNAVALGNGATTTQGGEIAIGDSANGSVTIFSVRPAVGIPVRHRNSANGWAIRDVGNVNDIFKVDESATADDVRLLLWDVTAGVLKRVTRGAVDSGGVGSRVLRIAN